MERVAILDLTDEGLAPGAGTEISVGKQLTLADLSLAIDELLRENPDIVVVHIDSTDLIEPAVQCGELFAARLADHRTAGWLADGINAPLVAVLPLDSFVMHPGSHMGVITGTTRSEGEMISHDAEELRHIRGRIETMAQRGGLDPKIAAAMTGKLPLSADLDPATGRAIALRQDKRGPEVLNRNGRWLALPADRAAELGVADGLADNREELARALGCTRVRWVGQEANRKLRDRVAVRLRERPSVSVGR